MRSAAGRRPAPDVDDGVSTGAARVSRARTSSPTSSPSVVRRALQGAVARLPRVEGQRALGRQQRDSGVGPQRVGRVELGRAHGRVGPRLAVAGEQDDERAHVAQPPEQRAQAGGAARSGPAPRAAASRRSARGRPGRPGRPRRRPAPRRAAARPRSAGPARRRAARTGWRAPAGRRPRAPAGRAAACTTGLAASLLDGAARGGRAASPAPRSAPSYMARWLGGSSVSMPSATTDCSRTRTRTLSTARSTCRCWRLEGWRCEQRHVELHDVGPQHRQQRDAGVVGPTSSRATSQPSSCRVAATRSSSPGASHRYRSVTSTTTRRRRCADTQSRSRCCGHAEAEHLRLGVSRTGRCGGPRGCPAAAVRKAWQRQAPVEVGEATLRAPGPPRTGRRAPRGRCRRGAAAERLVADHLDRSRGRRSAGTGSAARPQPGPGRRPGREPVQHVRAVLLSSSESSGWSRTEVTKRRLAPTAD